MFRRVKSLMLGPRSPGAAFHKATAASSKAPTPFEAEKSKFSDWDLCPVRPKPVAGMMEGHRLVAAEHLTSNSQ